MISIYLSQSLTSVVTLKVRRAVDEMLAFLVAEGWIKLDKYLSEPVLDIGSNTLSKEKIK